MYMSAKAKKELLFKQPLIKASEAREAGIHPAMLSYYQKRGLLERIERGLYRNTQVPLKMDFAWEELYLAVLGIPNGVVAGVSALALYNITEEIPRFHWIAVSHETSVAKRPMVKILRYRNYELGKTFIEKNGLKIPIYDIERVIIDSFRLLSTEVAIKALKMAFSSKHKPNIRKLGEYAKKLRVDIEPYILMVTT